MTHILCVLPVKPLNLDEYKLVKVRIFPSYAKKALKGTADVGKSSAFLGVSRMPII